MKLLKDKNGFTLVEMIAAFMLLVLFATAAALTVPSFLKTSMRVNSMSIAQSVSDMVSNTITSNLSSAADSASSERVVSGQYTPEVVIANDGKSVNFTDHYGYAVTIYIGADGEQRNDDAGSPTDVSGLLILHYTGNNVDRYWFYGKETYMGCKISSLNIVHLSENLIQYTITITTDTGYSFQTKKTIECYNLTNAAQIAP